MGPIGAAVLGANAASQIGATTLGGAGIAGFDPVGFFGDLVGGMGGASSLLGGVSDMFGGSPGESSSAVSGSTMYGGPFTVTTTGNAIGTGGGSSMVLIVLAILAALLLLRR